MCCLICYLSTGFSSTDEAFPYRIRGDVYLEIEQGKATFVLEYINC